MYQIEQKPWGYQLTFGDVITPSQMLEWVSESRKLLKSARPDFGVFVDMRTLQPLLPEAQAAMQEGQKLYKASGMSRSVVILASVILTLQFKRIARETGICEWERYINSSSTPNWQELGIAWVRDQIDPDQDSQ